MLICTKTKSGEMIDITRQVEEALGGAEGICTVCSDDSACAVVLCKKDAPALYADVMFDMDKLFAPATDLAAAACAAAVLGQSKCFAVQDGKPVLGAGQGICLAEFGAGGRRTVCVDCAGGAE